MKDNPKTIALLILILAGALAVNAQNSGAAPHEKQEQTTTAGPASSAASAIRLKTRSTVPVRNLYAPTLNSRPAKCGPDGDLYADILLIRPKASPDKMLSQTIVGIDRDGKLFLTVSPDKITDIPGAKLIDFFPTEDDLFLLVRAPESGGLDHDAPRQGGVDALFHKSDSEREFISRFDHGGDYIGSIGLDIPISGLQIGALPTGQFLISGVNELDRGKVALLKPSGALDRFIELPNKDRQKKDSAAGGAEESKGHLLYVAGFSELAGDEKNMLLISPSSPSVFEISPAGLAKEIKLRPGGSSVSSIQALPGGWLTALRHSGPEQHAMARLYSRTDGHLIRSYLYADGDDSVFGCMYQGELTFLRRDGNGRLSLVTASPAKKREASASETSN